MRLHNSIISNDRYLAVLIFFFSPWDDATYWTLLKEAKQFKESKYFILSFFSAKAAKHFIVSYSSIARQRASVGTS